MDNGAISHLVYRVLCNRKHLEEDDKKKAHFSPRKSHKLEAEIT